jgi:hypothetical protein
VRINRLTVATDVLNAVELAANDLALDLEGKRGCEGSKSSSHGVDQYLVQKYTLSSEY